MTVLHWITSKRCYRQYVQQRIDEINQLTPNSIWRHSPGVINPADLPSRGIKAEYLIDSYLWWNGPPFFQESDDKWPVNSMTEVTELVNAEMVRNPPVVVNSLVCYGSSTNEPLYDGVTEVMQSSKYSSFNRLLRVTAYV